jgi:hypothetical protein
LYEPIVPCCSPNGALFISCDGLINNQWIKVKDLQKQRKTWFGSGKRENSSYRENNIAWITKKWFGFSSLPLGDAGNSTRISSSLPSSLLQQWFDQLQTAQSLTGGTVWGQIN